MSDKKRRKQRKFLTIYKIGDADYPASADDIDNFEKTLRKAIKKGRSLVCHHLVSVERIRL